MNRSVWKTRVVALCAVWLFANSCELAFADDEPPTDGARYAPRRILVGMRVNDGAGGDPFAAGGRDDAWHRPPEPGSTRAVVEALIEAQSGGRLVHRFWFVRGLQIWEVEAGHEADAVAACAEIPWIQYAERDGLGKLARDTEPDDPAYQDGQQWYLNRVCMPQAWSVIQDITDYPIAVLDTGVNYLHPQLVDSILVNVGEEAPPGDGIDDDSNGYIDDYYGANVSLIGWSCAESLLCSQTCQGDPMDQDGHGTNVACIIAAQTDDCRSMAGIGWQAKIIPVKVRDDVNVNCDPQLLGSLTGSSVILGLEYAAARGAKVVNCSFGLNGFEIAVEYAFKSIEEWGMVVVVAAHNDGYDIDAIPAPPTFLYPAHYGCDSMLVVGASDKSDERWDYCGFPGGNCGSNYGAVSVDIFAPGFEIRVLDPGDSTSACTADSTPSLETGTSFAAPIVSGIAAMAWAAHPNDGPVDLANRIKSTARSVSGLSGLCVTDGMVDALNAVGGGPCSP